MKVIPTLAGFFLPAVGTDVRRRWESNSIPASPPYVGAYNLSQFRARHETPDRGVFVLAAIRLNPHPAAHF